MAMLPAPSGDGLGEDPGAPAPLSEINVTPLVDVMLVLLIVFMVAAPLMTVGVPVQLPTTAAPKVSQPKQPIIVTIDANGAAHLGEERLAPERIAERLGLLAREDPEQVVLVRGDRGVPYGRVMEVMGHVSAAGFAKVSLIAQAPPAGGP
jgi:biopolymer transport protein TolR